MRFLRLFVLLFLVQSCNSQSPKVNGVSFVASPNEATQEHVDAVVQLNANYAAVMPFGFIRNLESPEVIHNTDKQWFGETRAGAKQYIEILQKNKISVMMKPQIWIWRGEFTGYLKMDSEENWKKLEDSYTEFILTYAKLAQETRIPVFCIGTELEQFIVNRPKYWKSLISEIKGVYKGKLTYAANWDEYKRVPFWKELDFIGVDAYFPVSDSRTATLVEARVGWKPWKDEMRNISEREGRPILFTEYGYRSVDFAGKEPWKSNREMNEVNLEVQNNLTQALFEELYEEKWFAGGFIWKWFINHKQSGGHENPMFTPQNKPVEEIIRKQFEKS